jgi:hypothetical protein
MTRRFAPIVPLLLVALLPLGASAEAAPEQVDATITTSESIDRHEGRTESIDAHESGPESIDAHESRAGEIDAHESGAEQLDAHEESSESLQGRVVGSEALEGFGHAEQTPAQRLAAARAKLQAARQRHAQSQQLVHVPAAADPDAPAASSAVGERWDHWTSRIDVARHRIEVAQAVVDVWDESYARMIQADYPRGEARQDLIDSRNKAKQRLEREKAMLPRVLEAAREAGVPPGVLEQHGGASD